jgi:membrane protease YdiL (CAAX protease family)
VSAAISTGIIVGLDLLALRFAPSTNPSAKDGEDKSIEAGGIKNQLILNSIPHGKELIGFVPVCLVGAVWEELCFRGVALHLMYSPKRLQPVKNVNRFQEPFQDGINCVGL